MRTVSMLRRLTLSFLVLIGGVAQAAPTVTVFTKTVQTGEINSLVTGPDGLLYATTATGVFRLVNGALSPVATMSPRPVELIAGLDGNLYGVTSSGITNTILDRAFRLSPNGTVTILATFTDAIVRGLVYGSDGNLYGSKVDRGMFKLTTSGQLTNLTNYAGENLVEGAGGNLIGTDRRCTNELCRAQTSYIFEMTRSGAVTETGGSTCSPVTAALTAATDGTLYGVSAGYQSPYGGADGCLFSINAAGQASSLASFGTYRGSGTKLLAASDGTLFGIRGGACFEGPNGFVCHPPQLFRFRPPATTLLSTVQETAGQLTYIADTADPLNGLGDRQLAQTPDGTIYGTDGTIIYRLKRPTTLVGQGTMSINPKTGAITLNPKATLTDDMAKQGLAGQTVRFYNKGVLLCAAKTDVAGTATCQVKVTQRLGGFDAFFDETNLYGASQALHSPLLCVSGANCQ